ncbi:unnamed protein product, partial [Didymodactylos carnosus]
MYETPYVYSTQDLFETKAGNLQKVLEPIVTAMENHIYPCSLCSAKGFICEICSNAKDIIFPYELDRTSVCPVCQCCYHHRCFSKHPKCPKCERNAQR